MNISTQISTSSRRRCGARAGHRSRITKSERLLELNLMIGYWNVRGIKSRRFEVEKYAERYDIIILQETLLKPHDDYELPGFVVLRRDERRGTLVAIRDRPGLSFSSIDCSNFSTEDREMSKEYRSQMKGWPATSTSLTYTFRRPQPSRIGTSSIRFRAPVTVAS